MRIFPPSRPAPSASGHGSGAGRAVLFSTCVYGIRHGNFALKTDLEICRDLTGRNAAVCDTIDWKTTSDVHYGKTIARCQKKYEPEPDSPNVCNPFLCSYWNDWQPEHFPIAMPEPRLPPSLAP